MLTEKDLIKMASSNPYNDDGCPVCGEHAVSSCRCMNHSAEAIAHGHGLKCANGHNWARQKKAEEIVEEPHTPARKVVDAVTTGAKATVGAIGAGIAGIQSLDNKAPVRTIQ